MRARRFVMMTDEQKSKAAELKQAIAATASAPNGTPRGVREAVLGLKKELRRHGTTARELASALGVHETTLCRWEREDRPAQRAPRRTTTEHGAGARASSFRVVQLAAPETRSTKSPSPEATAAPSRGLRVAHAPSGLVIDGLDVETLAALLRRMS
jgi:transcriptional regulator with XRE-family HTH domain